MLKCNCDLTELIHPQKDYFIKKNKNKVHSINLQSVCNSWPVRCVEEHRTLLVMFMLLCRLFKCTLRSFYCIVLLLRSDVAGFIVVKEKCHSGHHTSAAASENPDFNQKHLIRIISHSFFINRIQSSQQYTRPWGTWAPRLANLTLTFTISTQGQNWKFRETISRYPSHKKAWRELCNTLLMFSVRSPTTW